MRTLSAWCCAALAVIVLAACASRSPTTAAPAGGSQPSTAAAPSSPVSAAPSCSTQGAGFDVSLVSGFVGSPDPISAAQWFEAHGAVPGFGSPSSVWRVIEAPTADGVLVVDGTIELHATQLPNQNWAIDSGRRCAT